MTISSYIEQDLEVRIRSGERPDRITIGAFAEHYGVSISPVRTAVDGLVAKNLLVKESNGRLRLGAASKRTKSLKEPQRPKDWDAVLAEEVLKVSLSGEEKYLREEALAERLGMGRTSLRSVLSRLAGRGLLEHVPRCGWKVHPFHEDDMRSYLEVRENLELQALGLARPHLIRADLERMYECNVSRSGDGAARLDNQLHRYFIDRSRNRYICEFFDSYGGYYSALFDYAALGDSVIEEMASQHREILLHVLNRRWAMARKALSNHIRAQQPVSMRLVSQLTEGAKSTRTNGPRQTK